MELGMLLFAGMTSIGVVRSQPQQEVVGGLSTLGSSSSSPGVEVFEPRRRGGLLRGRHLLGGVNESWTEVEKEEDNDDEESASSRQNSSSSSSSSSSSKDDSQAWIFWVQNVGLLGGVVALCYCRCYRLPPSRQADAYTELIIASQSMNEPSDDSDVLPCLEFCAAKGRTRLASDSTDSFYGPLAIHPSILSTGSEALSGSVQSSGAVEAFRLLSGRLLDSIASRVMEFHGPLTVDALTLRFAAVQEISSHVDFYARLLVKPTHPAPKDQSNDAYDVAYRNLARVVDRDSIRKLERTKLELLERCERWRRLASSPDMSRTLGLLSDRFCVWHDFDSQYLPNSSRLARDHDYAHIWTPLDSRAAAVALGIVIFVLDVESRTIEKFEPNRKLNHRRTKKLQGPHSDSIGTDDAFDESDSWNIRPPHVLLLQYSRLHYAALLGPHSTVVDLPTLPPKAAIRSYASSSANNVDKINQLAL